jgi:hypothetical protein
MSINNGMDKQVMVYYCNYNALLSQMGTSYK